MTSKTITRTTTRTTTQPAIRPAGIGTARGRALPRALTVALALILAITATACTGGRSESRQLDRLPAPDAGPSAGSDTGQGGGLIDSLPIARFSESSTRAIVVSDVVEVFDRPDGVPITTLAPTTTFGTTRVLLAEESDGDWVRVRLPARPNHRTGWIRSTNVQLETVDLAVTIDLQSRTMVVRSGLDMILQTPIAIGTDENPTPTGTFYVTDKLETPDPEGAYGPYALGLSGYSETLTEFAGGDGQIGIHGTDEPETIGHAASHGCIRLPNDVISTLAETLPLGTPVHIV
ncbi:MAG: L,D-transpeptidase [Actinomycetota bacterium]